MRLSQFLLLLFRVIVPIVNGGNIPDFSADNVEFAPKVTFGRAMTRREEREEGKCTLEMFSNNSAAYWACR